VTEATARFLLSVVDSMTLQPGQPQFVEIANACMTAREQLAAIITAAAAQPDDQAGTE
jgi:hypothetical protein